MSKVLVIADDLTGANDTGAAIRKMGWDTVSSVSWEGTLPPQACSCLCVNMDSRSIPADDAYLRMCHSVQAFRSDDVRIYSKRIDSTLRGNLGAETDAMLDSLFPGGSALIVPAFPQAGRTYFDDCVFVHGVPLPETAVAKDPKCPVHTGSALELFREQSKRQSSLIDLASVRSGPSELFQTICLRQQRGAQNLLFEAESFEDIRLIAKAASQMETPFIAVDPGAFTAMLVEEILGPPTAPPQVLPDFAGKKILAVIGSINDVAKQQAELLLSDSRCAAVVLDVEQLLADDACRQAERTRAADELNRLRDDHPVMALIFSSSMPGQSISLAPYQLRSGLDIEQLSKIINRQLAQLAVAELRKGYGALYTTGGDITLSVCHELECSCIQILDEILPLAVGGFLQVPSIGAVAIATKGGMIGDKDATCTCITYLQNMLKKKG